MRRGQFFIAVLCVIACSDDAPSTQLVEAYPGAIRDSSGMHSDEFGRALATNGSVLAIGAPMADAAAPDAGQVILYSIGDGMLPELVRLVRPDGEPQWGDSFGAALAFDGEFLAVGAPGVDVDGGQDGGAVFLFDGSTGEWTASETVVSPSIEQDQRFGSSITVTGDLLFVGAAGTDLEQRDVGAVFAFRRSDAGYVAIADLTDL